MSRVYTKEESCTCRKPNIAILSACLRLGFARSCDSTRGNTMNVDTLNVGLPNVDPVTPSWLDLTCITQKSVETLPRALNQMRTA